MTSTAFLLEECVSFQNSHYIISLIEYDFPEKSVQKPQLKEQKEHPACFVCGIEAIWKHDKT